MKKYVKGFTWHSHVWRGVVVGTLGSVVGCVDSTVPSSQRALAAEEILWTVQASPRGLTLAVGQQQQITATPRNILGDAMLISDTSHIRFSMLGNDTSRVQVSADGIVLAKTPTLVTAAGPIPVGVVASWTSGTITKADTVFVAVTATAPTQPATSLSIAPAPYPADSTWSAFFSPKVVQVNAYTADGSSIPNVYAFLYSNQRRRQLSDVVQPQTRSLVFWIGPGKFWLYATASVYGVVLQDSVELTTMDSPGVEYTLQNDITGKAVVSPAFANLMTPCGTIIFTNSLATPVTITFENPAATAVCVSGDETGNITLAPNATAARKIRVAGRYQWSAIHADGTPFAPGISGTVTVREHTEF